MTRISSIGSIVAPTLTTTRRPAKNALAAPSRACARVRNIFRAVAAIVSGAAIRPAPNSPAGLLPDFGSGDPRAVGDKLRDIAPRRRMRPHCAVHRRGDEQRALRRQNQSRRQIVGKTGRQTSDKIRAGRSDNDKIGGASGGDVVHSVVVLRRFPFVDQNRTTGKRAKSGDADEFLRVAGRGDLHRKSVAPQPPRQFRRPIRGNAAADNQQNPFHRGDFNTAQTGAVLRPFASDCFI